MHSHAYWINYFNSGHYFNSGCDVKLSLKFTLNHYWNNYFNSGRYFNSGCNIPLYNFTYWYMETSPLPAKGCKFDTGHPFTQSALRTRDNHTSCRTFGSETVTTCFNDLGLSRPRFEHPTFCSMINIIWSITIIQNLNIKIKLGITKFWQLRKC